MTSDRWVAREAHAKLNVFLRVLGRRDDGYHELESLVLPITLADSVVARAAPGLTVDVHGDADLTDAADPAGLNLALVAALTLAESCGAGGGAAIEITKRIPVAAGLGGGSADAAATLLALNALWGCGLDPATLRDVGARVGSDVPAMMLGAPSMMRGRGERVDPVTAAPTWWVVRPFPFGTRSPDAYRWWDEDGEATGPDPAGIAEALAAGDAHTLGASLFNDLEPGVIARHPEVGVVRDALLEAGALGAIVSGSGPTVVALARDRNHAEDLAATQEPDAIVVTAPPPGR